MMRSGCCAVDICSLYPHPLHSRILIIDRPTEFNTKVLQIVLYTPFFRTCFPAATYNIIFISGNLLSDDVIVPLHRKRRRQLHVERFFYYAYFVYFL
jgi:hypothetical protein